MIKKKLLFLQLLYYLLVALIYTGFQRVYWLLFDPSEDLGAATAFSFMLFFVATPLFILVSMRFSLLKWYVDPFAAAEIPLLYYFFAVIQYANLTPYVQADFFTALQKVHILFSNDGAKGYLYVAAIFLLGLLASFSPARRQRKSIGYKLIGERS